VPDPDTEAVRPWRTAADPADPVTAAPVEAAPVEATAVVAVTGAGSGAGAAVLRQLAASPRIRRVVGVDTTAAPPGESPPAPVAELAWRQADIVDPRLTEAFEGVTAVVHLAVDLRPEPDRHAQRQRNTRGAQTVLTAAFAAGARRVVLVTSAMVYGALPDNPVPLPDDAPLRTVPEASVVGDLLEIERIAAAARRTHRGLSVTVLRPAIVLGAGEREPLAALLSAGRLLRIRGHDADQHPGQHGEAPYWQFCHVSDLAAAAELAAVDGLDDAATVGCDGWLGHAELERVAGRRSLELPERIALGSAERLHRLGISPAPPSELAYLLHPWVVSSARLRAAGWQPAYTNAEAVRAHLAERGDRSRVPRLDARGATTAAAGAAVALVGTAALVRRARRRRATRH
jgi:nucleoside-diphosphate-sugar epimerase